MTAAAERYPAIDYLKAAAIVAVLVTHAGGNILRRGVPPLLQFSSVLASFHVPMFLMTAGFLATRAAPAGWREVGKRLQRILIPYLLATMVALALGYWEPRTLRKIVFVLVTGSGVGIYYFIPVLASCFVLLPLLSRVPTRGLVALVAGLALYATVAREFPSWRLSSNFFWGVRDVFVQFHLGHFVLGMLAARRLPALTRLAQHWRGVVLVACGAAIGVYVWYSLTYFLVGWRPLHRTVYMLSLAAIAACIVPSRPAPKVVRFLSDATLTLYLYHLFFQHAFAPETRELLPPALRLLLLSSLGLVGSTLIILAGRRLLGRQSRLLLGA